MSEQDIQRGVSDYLRRRFPPPAIITKVPITGMKIGNGVSVKSPLRGWPDLMLLLPPTGRYIGFECKRPKVKRRDQEHQSAKHEEIRAAGGLVYAVSCLEDVERACEEFGDATAMWFSKASRF